MRKFFFSPFLAFSALTAAVVMFSTTSCSSVGRDSMVTKEEMGAQKEWTKKHLTGKDASLPFSFKIGGVSSKALLAGCAQKAVKTRLDENRTRIEQVWTDEATGLQARNEVLIYNDYPVVEWTLYLKNTGTKDTPLITDFNGIDIDLPVEGGETPLLHGRRGDYEKAESFGPFIDTLSAGASATFAPPGSGKSTDGPRGWPYHNLQMSGSDGYIIVLGWPGQWEDTFTRKADVVEVRGGQQLFSAFLKPGEEIRTPLNLILFWKGKDIVASQNLWRRFYLAHVIPHFDGEPQQPAFEIQCSPAKGSIAYLQRYIDEGIKPDISWQDANWYPSSSGPYGPNGWRDETIPDWLDPLSYDPWLNTGDWEIDPAKFPDGFKDFSAFAKENGVQFLLWFEPERVGNPRSWLGRNHPEWLMPNPHGAILNEGVPEARMWLTNHIDSLIKENGLVWYREDMNGGGPCPAWRRNDSDGRVGITENFYVQGHLAYWDSLKARNPGLHIDACASGGRRDDLETMRRAVPLLRSDFQWGWMENLMRGNQGHTYGLSSWFPFQGTATYDTTLYASRSFYVPLFGTVGLNDGTKNYIKKAFTEQRAIARDMEFGDYYPLTPYSIGPEAWIAWQFNRPGEGSGVVQAFCREDCDASAVFRLRGLDPGAEYIFFDFDDGVPAKDASDGYAFKMKGRDLMDTGLPVTVAAKPAAKVFSYRKVR